ncbi:hypothetical protein [Phenylobacterium sp. J367]|uniref:hypothetical protein n=1 Tax=Phenylobacterium sp. J367 TaxID=2898435 RepID=UPI002150AD9D|nr:hypothetical protein [Phenylobacterium sp. J367]MCR5879876.1 hypothetical protein [Phenylobacterium sp. J367]
MQNNHEDEVALNKIYQAAAQTFLVHGAIDPPFVEIHTKGTVITVQSPLIRSDGDKVVFANLVRSYAIVTQADRVAVAMEAWSAPTNPSIRPSSHPERQEGVALICESFSGRYSAWAPISRRTFPHLGKLQVMDFRPVAPGGFVFHPGAQVDEEQVTSALALLHFFGHLDLNAAARKSDESGRHLLRLRRAA